MTANTRIHPLPIHLANQIAAGEVIERPASVVKELVENSIDAGAKQIDIDIDGAGSKLIRVRDNGSGIHADDLSLALSRHATSKLYSSEQLSQIDSLGFRGEALPSISSVSQLTLSSRQQESDNAWQLANDELSPTAHPLGTTIEVRDLFFNLPARRRFLRSNKTEQNHILTTLYRLALSRFDVGFSCQISNHTRLKLPASDSTLGHQQRIAKICGQSFIKSSLYLEQSYDEITLTGWFAKTSAHRPQTDIQYFFINGRVIRDRIINHAVRQAYAEHIPAGRHAGYVLYLTLPLDRVDVNVHPTKHEVRFRDARLIHGLITSALSDALRQADDSELPEQIQTSIELEPASTQPAIAEQAAPYRSSATSKPISRAKKQSPSITIETTSNLLHQRYLIVHANHQPMLIDLQQADHHLRQQTFLDALHTKTLKSRPILVPISVSLSQTQLALVQQHTTVLQNLGIELAFNNDSVQVKKIPSLLAQVNIQQLVHKISDALSAQQVGFDQLSLILLKLLPSSAISSIEQAKQVIQQLDEQLADPRWARPLDQQTLSSLFCS
ncbi:DNA mismatch repair protein MutL [Methylophaga sp. 41_12_T18]|mgnify:CR=1 FL=1|nr:DNA mismatch repair protein MutL [Methylophaga sp. 41_12_T18]